MVSAVTLIGHGEERTDDIGQIIQDEIRTDIFADVMSVSQSEFMSGGQMGLKPDLVFRVWRNEYNGEHTVDYDGTRYSVYRTYNANDGRVELYAEERVGNEQES